MNEALAEHHAEMNAMASHGIRQTGTARIASSVVALVTLEWLFGRPPRMDVDVCLDETDVRRVDAKDQVVTVRGDSRERGLRVTLENADYPDDTGWVVSTVDGDDAVCVAR